MNILFVNYGDFTTNSLNHIAAFASALDAQGHDCAVAIAGDKGTLSAISAPKFRAFTHEEALTEPQLFRDGRPADIIHAWTPRESVRRFVVGYKRKARSRLVVHLEDNEEYLLSTYMGRPIEELRDMLPSQFPKPLTSGLPHPVKHRALLRLAEGVTVIVDTLRAFVPAGVPTHLLEPGLDLSAWSVATASSSLRTELGLAPTEKIIVFTGSTTFVNEPEVRDLYLAVKKLNDSGCPTRLVRTGITSPSFSLTLPEDWSKWTIDLGFIDKHRLPGLLKLADALVQPGRPGPFNDYRLPSKLPEFLASGRPVVAPASNFGLQLTSGENGMVLAEATPDAIAEACRWLFQDSQRATAIGRAGSELARHHFDLTRNTRSLLAFYSEILTRPAQPAWNTSTPSGDMTALAAVLRQKLADFPGASLPAFAGFSEISADLARLVCELEDELSSPAEHTDRLRLALERERDEWKATWTLTQQHARNLEDSLRASRGHIETLQGSLSATRQHAENLEEVLAIVRSENEEAQILRHQAETLLRAARHQLTVFEGELARSEHVRQQLEAELGQVQYQLADTRARALSLGETSKQEIARLRDLLRESIRQREDIVFQKDQKIRTMQRSLSWRITSPFRALRRRLIDPLAKKRPAPAAPGPNYDFSSVPDAQLKFAPAEFVAPIKAFRYSVDYPNTWGFSIKKVVIRGWCLTTEAAELKQVRARIGQRTYPGVYGLKRMDVLAALRDVPQAEYCGFKIEVILEETDSELTLEVGDAHGAWHRFFTTEIRVGADLGQPELTSYERWAVTYDSHTPDSVRTLAENVSLFLRKPLISILVPVYHRKPEDEKWLIKAIESVRGQAYENWELCLADDASPAPHVRPLLERYAREDKRIKVIFREKNGHISAASNSALELATGEFIALLDHDDELTPNALYEVIALINVQPDVDYIYSDEDKIDEEGRRHEPYFKPDFLPDLFTSQNYTSHLSVYRAEIFRRIGGFRIGYEGSQDWDLALRFIEQTKPERIRHIPRVLYHWRAIPGSTALLISEKNYPVEAARKALADHFQRRGETVELIPVPGDHWRVRRKIPSPAPKVSLIIPTRNGLKLISRCLDTLLDKTSYPSYEVLIIDNGSDEPATLEYFKKVARDPRVRVIRYDAPFNYSAINNFGAKHATGSVLGLLNNDLEIIHADWLDEMVSQAVRPEIGCVGAMLYYPNDTIQHAGVIVGMGGVAGHAFRDFPRGTEGKFNRARLVQNYSSVTAACLIVRKSVYDEVGGLDETLAVAFNDIDFCLKVRARGYRNLWTPFAELYHHESASRGAEDTPEKHERFRGEVEKMLARWKGPIAHDPAYNPNLSLELTDFTLAAPPRSWKP